MSTNHRERERDIEREREMEREREGGREVERGRETEREREREEHRDYTEGEIKRDIYIYTYICVSVDICIHNPCW